jgi:hypothetical protein
VRRALARSTGRSRRPITGLMLGIAADIETVTL